MKGSMVKKVFGPLVYSLIKKQFDVERISLPNKSAIKLINIPESTCVFESHFNVLS